MKDISLPDRLLGHVRHLAFTIGERHFASPGTLESASDYIDQIFREAEYTSFFQEFSITRPPLLSRLRSPTRWRRKPLVFKNVVAHLPGRSKGSIVVGAHYDTVWGSPGADDNASGVAVLLETARLLKGFMPHPGITFVAFANEEPPFSRTSAMGSAHFVKAARANSEKIVFMLCLEMVGFYTDRPGSQAYPLFLKYFYPDRGNFIAAVGNLKSRSYVTRVKQAFEREANIPMETLSAPRFVRGVDFSDHMNFWNAGIPAVMITDTAFYRNPHYHQMSDLPQTLDFHKMAEVTLGVVSFIRAIAGR